MREPKNKLVLVEGLTGLGKSTLAHFICRQFRYNGLDARWIHEGEDPHPVSMDIEPDIAKFQRKVIERWESFVAKILEEGVVTVVEASFFNNMVESLYAHCLDPKEIIRFGLKLQETIAPAEPTLVYLLHPDISTALEGNFRNRGPGFQDFVIDYTSDTPIAQEKGWDDYAGMVNFWEGFIAITDSLFDSCKIDKIALDASAGDWFNRHQQLAEFLELDLIADPTIDFDTAEKFLGNYTFDGGSKKYMIQYKDGYLVTDAFMNVATKLIPENEVAFLAEGWHFKLVFEIDRTTGRTCSFTIGGHDIDYLKAVGMTAMRG